MNDKNNKKPNILCICAVGLNRSKYLATYLKNKGYRTRYGGVECQGLGCENLINQKDVDWADVIIIIRKRLEPIFREKFRAEGKKIFVLDVTDSQNLAPDKFKQLESEEFQRQWTRPQLRKAVRECLKL